MKRNILLVDDDPSLLATLGDFLESEGYFVTKASSGENAMLSLRASPPDLIVLDMSMPGIGGMGVLDRIMLPDGRMQYPVLVLTARARMAEYFADKQVDGFIAKPADPEDLLMEVSRILFQRGGTSVKVAMAKQPELFLVESSDSVRDANAEALTSAGYNVSTFKTGSELIEAAVLNPPQFVVLNVSLEGQSANIIVNLLKTMSVTASTPILVYGIGESNADLESVAALDSTKCKMITSSSMDALIQELTTLKAFSK